MINWNKILKHGHRLSFIWVATSFILPIETFCMRNLVVAWSGLHSKKMYE